MGQLYQQMEREEGQTIYNVQKLEMFEMFLPQCSELNSSKMAVATPSSQTELDGKMSTFPSILSGACLSSGSLRNSHNQQPQK